MKKIIPKELTLLIASLLVVGPLFDNVPWIITKVSAISQNGVIW